MADRKLNQADVQHVMKITNDIVKQNMTLAIQHVVQQLEYKNSNLTEIKDITDKYLSETMTSNLFAGLENQYAQEKYFTEKYGMIVPQLITLPHADKDYGRVRTNWPQQTKKQNYVIISIIR